MSRRLTGQSAPWFWGQRYRRRFYRLGYGLGITLVCCWLWAIASPAWSQATEPSTPTLIETLETLAPAEIQPLLNWSGTQISQAPVRLDGRTVITVAALAVTDGLTAQARAQYIERRLKTIARQYIEDIEQQRLTPADLTVTQRVDEQSRQPVLSVNDQDLLTITALDVQLSGSVTLRVSEVIDAVETALTRYYHERQPQALWQQTYWAIALIGLALIISVVLAKIEGRLQRWRTLATNRVTRSPHLTLAESVATTGPPTTALRHSLLDRYYQRLLVLKHQLLHLGQILIWVGLGFALLGLYPHTRWLQPLLITLLRFPTQLLLVGLGAYGLIRFTEFWFDRLCLTVEERAEISPERSQRLVLRLSTFSAVIKGVVAVAITIAAVLITLSQFGVEVAPLLAGAGILGIAISLASQSVIKDIINGTLILVEDQYGVGDVIVTNGVAGFVETMNLRITQLRNEEGRLITIPNGQIAVVENLSKEWSRVDLKIPVGLSANLDEALELVDRVAQDLDQDQIWGSLILVPPQLLGVDHLDHAGAIIRMWIQTQPLKQWDVAREYRRRLKAALDQAGIPIGVPQQQVMIVAPEAKVPTSVTSDHHHG
ncbi:MAG: mechanosensitive ion channel family protein [Cyanobacteria bacterium]|nr:mechanosensitive ion channel family protein [Cyanobacteriota bacterium]